MSFVCFNYILQVNRLPLLAFQLIIRVAQTDLQITIKTNTSHMKTGNGVKLQIPNQVLSKYNLMLL